MNENPTAEPTVAESQEVQDTTLNAEITENPEQTETVEDTETTEKPLGEILQDEQVKESVKPDFKELYKKERKDKRQLEAKLKQLESDIEDEDVSDDEIQSNIDDIAEEFNVDKKFLKKLEKAIKGNLEANVESTLSNKLKPLEEKERADKFKSDVTTYFNNAIERMPEYKEIANLNTILQLASIPSNQKKTVSQLIEETFGAAIIGKKTIESSTVRGNVDPTEVDFNKAKNDTEYFKQVMANPELKKKYNAGLAQRALR
jgi:hypothetical protein